MPAATQEVGRSIMLTGSSSNPGAGAGIAAAVQKSVGQEAACCSALALQPGWNSGLRSPVSTGEFFSPSLRCCSARFHRLVEVFAPIVASCPGVAQPSFFFDNWALKRFDGITSGIANCTWEMISANKQRLCSFTKNKNCQHRSGQANFRNFDKITHSHELNSGTETAGEWLDDNAIAKIEEHIRLAESDAAVLQKIEPAMFAELKDWQ
jgi:hypothetical protein